MPIWIFARAGALLLLHLLVVGVAEISVHPPVMRRPCDTGGMALHVARSMGATAKSVRSKRQTVLFLSAWWLQPAPATGPHEAVLMCHGVADTALGVMGAALMYLRNGYSVFAPDNRVMAAAAALSPTGFERPTTLPDGKHGWLRKE